MIRSGGLASVRGTQRLARHLWRMCFALFTMLYWLWRVRVKRRLHGLVELGALRAG